MAAKPLIHTLLARYPQIPLLITVTTPTGRDRAKSLFGDTVYVCYLPYDLQFLITFFINKINPKLLIIIETELWPNLLAVCRKKHIPSILANGRLSSRSTRAYATIHRFIKAMLKNIDQVAVRNAKDGKFFLSLGLEPHKLRVIGNLKFDLVIPEHPGKLTEDIKTLAKSRPIWIAASTHEGEEKQIINAHRQLLKKIPTLLLILVPRHQERFTKIHELLLHHHFDTARASTMHINANTEVLLGDTMGQLMEFYAASDVAFVGGSFVPTGGHNVLEPAAQKVPVIVGPYNFNFPEINQKFLKMNALIQVDSVAKLTENVLWLLTDKQKHAQMTEAANKIIKNNQGALRKLMELINEAM